MSIDLARINSATKYPSIENYHVIDPTNGMLGDLNGPNPTAGPIIATEKIDGTNGRIILMPDGDWFLGSRQELVYARGDRYRNPKDGLVDGLVDLAAAVAANQPASNAVVTLHGEFYGTKLLPAWKTYSDGTATGFRVFDVSIVRPDVLDLEVEQIALWRQRGGQRWLTADEMLDLVEGVGLQLAPSVATLDPASLPTGTIDDTLAWMTARLPSTRAVLLRAKHPNQPEGLVLRTEDRRWIRKLRFAEYRNTIRRRDMDTNAAARQERQRAAQATP